MALCHESLQILLLTWMLFVWSWNASNCLCKFSVCIKHKGLSLTPFCWYFTLSPVNNTKGHSAKVLKNRCSLDLRRFFFSERVVDQWNSLPQHVIDSGSIKAFKNGLNTMRRDSMGFFVDWLVRLALRPHMFLSILWNRCSRAWYLVHNNVH